MTGADLKPLIGLFAGVLRISERAHAIQELVAALIDHAQIVRLALRRRTDGAGGISVHLWTLVLFEFHSAQINSAQKLFHARTVGAYLASKDVPLALVAS
jgi:hypothetical protein